MTRIAIFCDGTWNSPDMFEPTHVARLSAALLSDPAQGQVAAYFAGIGTDTRFDGPVGKFLNKWGGGAFGWGLDAKVKQAYQFIARIYRPGDSLYVFGFSRGAYTARSVVGMVRKCGIVADSSPAGINAAFELYRTRGKRGHPDHPTVRAARAKMSPRFATSPLDLQTRSGTALVDVAFVGVWDTVGARGIPPAVMGPVATLWNRQYRFHDMQLSRLVRRARHAVALDEMRVFFHPALWANLSGPKGLNRGDTGPGRPYQQMWFIGNHAIVGGSAGVRALSAFPLEWILQGAPELTLKPGARIPPEAGNAGAITALLTRKPGLLARWRKGPRLAHEIHPSVRARIEALRDYRPGSLRANRATGDAQGDPHTDGNDR